MRQMARSFFWIDQQLIRSGQWAQLSIGAKLAYVALAASVDRQGVSQWSRAKLMLLTGASELTELAKSLIELQEHKLIALPPVDSSVEIRVLSLEAESTGLKAGPPRSSPSSDVVVSAVPATMVIVHTTVHIGGSGPC